MLNIVTAVFVSKFGTKHTTNKLETKMHLIIYRQSENGKNMGLPSFIERATCIEIHSLSPKINQGL